ncbi:YbhB/YbcL family Raf kinase inhibitor-like protein [Sphingomonas montanisoli]|uniref:YbhB/YbcL family Raf kinase inhibitor-like protein n=1 Tax=Sphingomonas montanisoli TaxID=2606412 RepID=A0A5D9C1N6_9SPHN|nr:YbhB/YbcL family Raf kinase inhibitor-like protein [Sphingomonas montanisoli]TZG25778.1 YbhB/YbcL family Raf kinase inhibitor-like protein [Sphingomonas montanisoli]
MLEHVPHWLGQLLSPLRAGHEKLLAARPDLAVRGVVELMSPAFAHGARLPERFTADGAGVSPPLVWGELPEGTAGLALIVEDPDAPLPNPLVHALVWNLPPDTGRLAEGAIVADGDGGADGRDVGRTSYGREGWLPPDPPTGHGSHDYVFQIFALSEVVPLAPNPGRGDLAEAIAGRILAAGILIGTYQRGDAAPAFVAGSPGPALAG